MSIVRVDFKREQFRRRYALGGVRLSRESVAFLLGENLEKMKSQQIHAMLRQLEREILGDEDDVKPAG